MKILYINGSRIPTERAHGLQIMKMCGAFAGIRNVEVELWVTRRFNYIKSDPFEYYGIQKNFRIRKFFCVDLVPCYKFLGSFAFWITELSFLVSVAARLFAGAVSCGVWGRSPHTPQPLAWQDHLTVEVTYTRDKFVAFFLSFFKKNIIFEAHDVPAKIFFLRLKRVKGVVAITQCLKDEFIKRGVSAGKIIVAPDGVDLKEFDIPETKGECRRKLNLPLDQKIVLYTGHLYTWKGTDTLLDAAAKYQVSNTKYQVLFTLVGGTDKEIYDYELRVTSYESRNIKIVGHRPHSEIPYWLKAADILVLPNSAKYGISKYWTSPMKLFEYMAAERPIIASDLPSIREVLSEKNAKLVAPDSAESLASAIVYLLNNQLEAGRISAQAREDVKLYTWEKRAERIWQFFQRK